jgi:hypothetical protein
VAGIGVSGSVARCRLCPRDMDYELATSWCAERVRGHHRDQRSQMRNDHRTHPSRVRCRTTIVQRHEIPGVRGLVWRRGPTHLTPLVR